MVKYRHYHDYTRVVQYEYSLVSSYGLKGVFEM